MLRKKKDKESDEIIFGNTTMSKKPVIINTESNVTITTDIQMSLNEYLARHNRNRNLDRAITAFCHKRDLYFNTKEKWDNIIIEFFS